MSPWSNVRLFRRLVLPIGIICLLVAFGSIGYMIIEGYNFLDAIYMTVITVGSVGYEEVHQLSRPGMVFTIILIFLNLAVFTFFIALLTRYIADGEFQREYKKIKMENNIAKLHNHVIICGLGRNGLAAAQVMYENQIPFVVLEVKELDQTLHFPIHYFIIGDARNDDMLKKAGIDKARALLTTLPDDADNLYVVLSARQENPKLKIISRASRNASVAKLKIAGASNVIMPDELGGAHMATLVMHPDILELISLMTTRSNEAFRIEELHIKENVSLGELNLWKSTGCTVLGVKNNKEYLLNPPPDYNLNPGERIIVMGSNNQIEKVKLMI
jgi:voltage-gated potassium channel